MSLRGRVRIEGMSLRDSQWWRLRVHRQQACDLVGFGIEHGTPARRYARIVDENVDEAEIGYRLVGHGDDLFMALHRGGIGPGAHAEFLSSFTDALAASSSRR